MTGRETINKDMPQPVTAIHLVLCAISSHRAYGELKKAARGKHKSEYHKHTHRYETKLSLIKSYNRTGRLLISQNIALTVAMSIRTGLAINTLESLSLTGAAASH